MRILHTFALNPHHFYPDPLNLTPTPHYCNNKKNFQKAFSPLNHRDEHADRWGRLGNFHHAKKENDMGVLPSTKLAQIEWFEQRLAAWVANTAAIGLSPDQVSQLQGEIAAARGAYMSSQQARNDSKSATVTFYDATVTLVDDGRDLITTIKAFAEATGDNNVYALADVPPPSDPVPAGPPQTPEGVEGNINSDGAVELTWKGTLAFSTFFEVLRKIEGETTWTVINSVGTKEYLDETVPVGTTSVQYRVRAKRGAETSAANDPITIRIGVEQQTGSTGLNIAA